LIKKEFDIEKFRKDWVDPTISQKGLEFIYNFTFTYLFKKAKKYNLGKRNRKWGREVGWNLKNDKNNKKNKKI
jgi:hypothetical protein